MLCIFFLAFGEVVVVFARMWGLVWARWVWNGAREKLTAP